MTEGEKLSKNELKRRAKVEKKAEEKAAKEAAAAAAAPAASASKAKKVEEPLDPGKYHEHRCQTVLGYKDAGETPYPHKFHVSISMTSFIEKYSAIEDGAKSEDIVSVAGRIHSIRESGAKLR